MSQPIIRGIEAVGSVKVLYRYNGNKGILRLPDQVMRLDDKVTEIDTSEGVEVSGFRLDSNFLSANPQIASSFMIPILGGGALALTNNNRSGTLTITSTRVSTPVPPGGGDITEDVSTAQKATGAMLRQTGAAIGPIARSAGDEVYDLVLLAQAQQAQDGGDSQGSTIQVSFKFSGLYTVLEFQGCTIAQVMPVALSGNEAVDYGVQINYLNWTINMSSGAGTAVSDGASFNG